ncbi:unnamed protein product [Auanema sp. JU1783]|nr:unnamed protein product [Auanema sp. JU1783]
MLHVFIDLLTFPNLCAGIFLLISAAIGGIGFLSFMTPWISRKRSELLEDEHAYGTKEVIPTMLKANVEDRPRFTEPSLYLSIVVPAMNEEERLPGMLDECLEYCESRKVQDNDFTYEVVVVDDGSRDKTALIASDYGKRFGTVKAIKLPQNRGKGGAVRVGVLHSAGKLVLFADADGATKFSDIEKLEHEMTRSSGGSVDPTFPGIVVGSRAHLEEEASATRSVFRTLLMHGFHVLVYAFTVRTIRDTQCGFKLFTRAAAARLFPVLHVERWAFDVELLYLAEKWKMSIKEVSVVWEEKEGSKIVPVWSWLQMGRDLLLIWFRYTVGIWTDNEHF